MPQKRKVAIVTPEYHGVAMVGGLAMAVSGLVKALRERDVDARAIMPMYRRNEVSKKFLADLGIEEDRTRKIAVHEGNVDGVPVYHIDGFRTDVPDSYNASLSILDSAYKSFSSNAFCAFSSFSHHIPTILNMVKTTSDGWTPDVIHLHEWQTASASSELKRQEKYKHVPIVLTIHNVKYTGVIPDFWVDRSYVSFNHDSPLRKRFHIAAEIDGNLFTSLLEQGAFYADAVTTVSPAYVQDICEKRGDGLPDERTRRVLMEKGLVGILNGIDSRLFDPSTDKYIPYKFDPKSQDSVREGKNNNKKALLEKFKVETKESPLVVSMLSRLTAQKGVDEVIKALSSIAGMEDVMLFIIGERDGRTNCPSKSEYANVVIHPEFVGPELQHLVLAGSDAILMPSTFEPCGYTWMEGLRYDALPIATQTGGMNAIRWLEDDGYGIKLNAPTSSEIVRGINQLRWLHGIPERFERARRKALDDDFSWCGARNPVGKYIDLYEELLEKERIRQLNP